MRNIRMLTGIFTAVLLLQACTLATLQLENKLKTRPSSGYATPCNVKYYISIGYSDAFAFTPNIGLEVYPKYVLPRYIKATQEMIEEKGCTASYVEHEEANLKIQIVMKSARTYLPVHLLFVGPYMGLIPFWWTHKGEYKYYFETGNETLSYSADLKEYSHLIFLPIALPYFLTTLVTKPEMDVYRQIFINFIGES